MDNEMKLKIAYLAIAGVVLALLTAMSSCSNQSMASEPSLRNTCIDRQRQHRG